MDKGHRLVSVKEALSLRKCTSLKERFIAGNVRLVLSFWLSEIHSLVPVTDVTVPSSFHTGTHRSLADCPDTAYIPSA